jgi:predicted regulator of Ras-like GTPase activity (Roadblock/LC7/MglB family)
MTPPYRDHEQLAWMLKQVVDQPEVHDALLVSGDGLVRAHSDGLSRDDAERIAAALSGVQATSAATADFCRSGKDSWRQSLTEFNGGFVLVVKAAQGSYLAVATSGAADVGQIAYRMHEVVGQLGTEMTTAPRQEPAA